MRPRLTNTLGKLFLGQSKFLNQPMIAFGLLESVEILALQILYQGNGQGVSVSEVLDQGRRLVQSGHGGGTPPSFASNDLEPAAICRMWPGQQWLQDTSGPDRRGELCQSRFVHRATGLKRPRLQQVKRDRASTTLTCGARRW